MIQQQFYRLKIPINYAGGVRFFTTLATCNREAGSDTSGFGALRSDLEKVGRPHRNARMISLIPIPAVDPLINTDRYCCR